MGPQVNKTEMEKMFNTAMASIKGNDEMWVKLNACGLQDGKAKKVGSKHKCLHCQWNGTVAHEQEGWV